LPATAASTAVARAVGTGTVPRHADKQRTLVAEVGGPPVLRVSHQRRKILFQSGIVQALERLSIVEILAHGIGERGVVMQQIQVQVVRPPVAIRRAWAAAVMERALC